MQIRLTANQYYWWCPSSTMGLKGAIVFLSVISLVHGFSVGIPPLRSVCSNMNPQHHDYKAQGGESPFMVTVDRTEVRGGDDVRVSVGSLEPDQTKFIGFYVQARDENDAPIGTFTPNKDTKVHSCGGVRANGAHHANGNIKKENVTITWNAPRQFDGEVVFTATALRDFVTYWVFLQSDPVIITKERDALFESNPSLSPIVYPSSYSLSNSASSSSPSNNDLRLRDGGLFPMLIPGERLAGGIRQIFQDIGGLANRLTAAVFPGAGSRSRNRINQLATTTTKDSIPNGNNVLPLVQRDNNSFDDGITITSRSCENVHIFKRFFCMIFQNQGERI